MQSGIACGLAVGTNHPLLSRGTTRRSGKRRSSMRLWVLKPKRGMQLISLFTRIGFGWTFLPWIKEERAEYTEGTDLSNKGIGMFVYLSVDDVDEFHKDLLSKGLKPLTKPQNQPWGNREFIIRDPDGYKLVIFKRK
jgi:catechol 2,3-dioxygenase-like lactoylglutathione lyase family enzyme